ncbi:MAG: hypothetical protein L3J67_04215 [Hyphomicrobiaceae bacterium]|nr:hypothetical protein [Hyphomicrobiaceae bacterium]
MDTASMALEIFSNFVQNNQLGAAIAGGLVIGVSGWGVKIVRDKFSGNKIYKFLQNSQENTSHTYRSTEAIASDVKLPEARVEYLCSHHPKIRRNSAEKQSWTIVS